MSDIVNTKSEKIREKYVHERSRAMTDRERRLNSRFSRRQTRTERLTLTDAARMNAKLKETEQKKILDRQKKLENERQAREKDLHEKRRLMAEEHLKHNIHKLTQERQASVSEKDFASDIKRGNVDRGIDRLKESGREGGLFNDHARLDASIAKDAEIIKKESHILHEDRAYKGIIGDILQKASTPAENFNEMKRQDKADQNLEGRRNKESTGKQMAVEQMKKLRGAAYNG